jgi:quercetin dioxygenase-like cupin family protein
MYTGSDGHTHFEDVDPDSHPELTQLQAAESISCRVAAPGRFNDWHNAPRRQFVITLQGEYEIGLKDGTVRRFGPGHVTWAEDTTGSGHTTRVVSSVPRIAATIPLAEGSPQ